MSEVGLVFIASISIAGERELLAIAAPQDDDVLVLLDQHAGEDPAVGRGDDVSWISLADLGRWG